MARLVKGRQFQTMRPLHRRSRPALTGLLWQGVKVGGRLAIPASLINPPLVPDSRAASPLLLMCAPNPDGPCMARLPERNWITRHFRFHVVLRCCIRTASSNNNKGYPAKKPISRLGKHLWDAAKKRTLFTCRWIRISGTAVRPGTPGVSLSWSCTTPVGSRHTR